MLRCGPGASLNCMDVVSRLSVKVEAIIPLQHLRSVQGGSAHLI